MTQKKPLRVTLLVVLGSITWGVSMLMRTSFGYCGDELSLSATLLGLSNAILCATVCVSAVIMSKIVEKTGRLFTALSFSLSMCASAMLTLALSQNLSAILLSRVLLGVGCGPIFSLTMKATEVYSTEESYPVNAGIVTNGEAIFNTILGPVILVALLNTVGLVKMSVLFTVILGFESLAWLGLGKKLGGKISIGSGEKVPLKAHLNNRGLMLCIAGGALTLVAGWCIYMYAPTILKLAGNLSDTRMSFVMTSMGIFMAVWLIVGPILYSHLNRRWFVSLGCVLGAVGLIGLSSKNIGSVAVILFVLFGGFASAMSLFFMAILSLEFVDPAASTSALALVNGGCELLGASIGPAVAGWIADRTTYGASILVAVICMLLAAFIPILMCLNKSKEK